jgi:hypothetical protein
VRIVQPVDFGDMIWINPVPAANAEESFTILDGVVITTATTVAATTVAATAIAATAIATTAIAAAAPIAATATTTLSTTLLRGRGRINGRDSQELYSHDRNYNN